MAHYYLSYEITYQLDEEQESEFDCSIVEANSLDNAKKNKRYEILMEYGNKTKIKWDECYRTTDDARL